MCVNVCVDPMKTLTLAVLLLSLYPDSHRFTGMPAKNCPTCSLTPAHLELMVRLQQGREKGRADYVKVG